MIYVLSPLFRTGGVELLHQLAHELSKYTDVVMCYADHGSLIDEYAQYQTDHIFIEDLSDNTDFVIVPEIWARMAIGRHKKVIFWESVDNYLARSNDVNFDPNIIHLAQSEYAYQFLLNTVGAAHILRVSDYINEDFLEPYDEKVPRKPVVLFNPAKGMEHTQKIIDAMPDVHFIPLSGLSRIETRNLMRESMAYIDLGNHPGKDRMPREAAASGCCIVTSLNGSAKYRKDVPIPNEYKFYRTNVTGITTKIREILSNYETCRRDFSYYREHIRFEKQLFKSEVKLLATVILVDIDLAGGVL